MYATPSTVTGTTTKTVTANLSNLELGTLYYVRIKVENCSGYVYSNTKTFTTDKKGTFVDSRDNTTYVMVKIGAQVWMVQNLAYLPSSTINCYKDLSSTFAKYYVYGYTGTSVSSAKATTEYKRYGVLYNRIAATLSSTCPSGWRLPTDDDWKELEGYLGMSLTDQNMDGYRGTTEESLIPEKSGFIL